MRQFQFEVFVSHVIGYGDVFDIVRADRST